MKTTRDEVRFLLNDHEVRLKDIKSSDTLLDHLRLDARLCGTKEGCAEGDCGACTVLVGRRAGGRMVYDPVNSCIRLLASVDLCHVVTVEALAGEDGALSPVQQAMVDHHGSQCGFCTPGFVMSLHALRMRTRTPSEAEVETALQGNLCRCTGYQPIVAAARAVPADALDSVEQHAAAVRTRLDDLDDGTRVEMSSGGDRIIIPASVDDLADVLMDHDRATIVAGSTDVGLWVTKFMRDISPAIFTAGLSDFRGVEVGASGITLDGGASYDEAESAVAGMYPHLRGYWRRIGGWQVRAMGTVGGNIANGSPIGDTPPALISLDATVTLRRGNVRRTIPLESFFIAYGKQDRQPHEFVERIFIPSPPEGALDAAYKVTKRRDEDISAVAAGFRVVLDGGIVTAARLAFGGMAATPKRASAVEAALIGKPWTEATVRAALPAVAEDFAPLSDWRGTAEYRLAVARNLLLRFYLEASGAADVRLDRRLAV